MRQILGTVSFSAVLVMVATGSMVAESRAGQSYGPRAGYSPFQRTVSGARSSEHVTVPFVLASQDTMEEEKPVIEEIKKPGRAFFVSALVPGLGQLYAGARTRGFVFLGIEAAAVTYALVSNSKGNKKENEYIKFADEHWIVEKYNDKRYDAEEGKVIPPSTASWYGSWSEWYEANALNPLEDELTHHLPEITGEDGTFREFDKNHDYYEMIGKYDQFVYGWDDVHDSLAPGDDVLAPDHDIVIWGEAGLDTAHFDPYIADVRSDHRNKYMDMRHESNKAFKRAKTMVGVILFNHVISAIDAARSARNYNLKHGEVKTSLRMRLKNYEGAQIPQLVLTHRFY